MYDGPFPTITSQATPAKTTRATTPATTPIRIHMPGSVAAASGDRQRIVTTPTGALLDLQTLHGAFDPASRRAPDLAPDRLGLGVGGSVERGLAPGEASGSASSSGTTAPSTRSAASPAAGRATPVTPPS